MAEYRRLQRLYVVACGRNDVVAIHCLVPRLLRAAEALGWPDDED